MDRQFIVKYLQVNMMICHHFGMFRSYFSALPYTHTQYAHHSPVPHTFADNADVVQFIHTIQYVLVAFKVDVLHRLYMCDFFCSLFLCILENHLEHVVCKVESSNSVWLLFLCVCNAFSSHASIQLQLWSILSIRQRNQNNNRINAALCVCLCALQM